jgi:hypothetical protein
VPVFGPDQYHPVTRNMGDGSALRHMPFVYVHTNCKSEYQSNLFTAAAIASALASWLK